MGFWASLDFFHSSELWTMNTYCRYGRTGINEICFTDEYTYINIYIMQYSSNFYFHNSVFFFNLLYICINIFFVNSIVLQYTHNNLQKNNAIIK